MIGFRKTVWTCLLALVLAVVVVAPAQASFSITSFDGESTKLDGSALTQAGAHPDVSFEAHFTTTINQQGEEAPDGSVKTVRIDLPAGLVGNPAGVPVCPEKNLVYSPLGGSLFSSCPDDSVVGVATSFITPGGAPLEVPLANLQPTTGYAAQFGFNVFGTIVRIGAFTAEGGHRIVSVVQVPQGAPTIGVRGVLWGIPSEEAHDPERAGQLPTCGDEGPPPCDVSMPRKPFMSSPTDCASGPSTTVATANSWQQPDVFSQDSFVSHLPDGTPSGVTGCDVLQFGPRLRVMPTSREAGAPTGLDVTLTIPQDQNPDSLATAHLKDATVTLPAGMSVNASQANGLEACSPEQIGLGTDSPVSCPAASTLGTVEVETPLLEQPVKGAVYLAQQGTNPFNSLLAMYVVASAPERGVLVKLAGKISPDPQTGQLTASFADNPQMPFETLRMQLNGGERAALVMPSSCGTYTTHASFASWAAPSEAVASDSTFPVDQGCGRASRFVPGFEAGSADPVAGSHAAFTLRVTREDGQQNVAGIEATLPKGLSAKLAGVPLCPEGATASGACPQASQVGSATVGAGAGAFPVYVPQPGKPGTAVYLAGPYEGAPYSLVVKVPAQAGPFDLGTVAVRNALYVDPVTAQVTAKSDPLPQILQGIPIAYRDIRVDVDRSGFALNPTSCAPMSVTGVVGSSAGQSAQVSDRFQVGDCASLGFSPNLKLKVSGGMKRGGFPKLRAELRAPAGQANIGRVSVALPHSEFLAQAHIRTICTRVQYAAKACPPGSIYGWARAFTPLLDRPLEGPVYLRSSNNPLPDLVASLDGQIHIDLAGRIDSVNGGIRSTFEAVPDAPVSKFVLAMQGGKKGLLENSRNLCRSQNRGTVQMDGQNGKAHDFRPVVGNSCGKTRKGGKKRK